MAKIKTKGEGFFSNLWRFLASVVHTFLIFSTFVVLSYFIYKVATRGADVDVSGWVPTWSSNETPTDTSATSLTPIGTSDDQSGGVSSAASSIMRILFIIIGVFLIIILAGVMFPRGYGKLAAIMAAAKVANLANELEKLDPQYHNRLAVLITQAVPHVKENWAKMDERERLTLYSEFAQMYKLLSTAKASHETAQSLEKMDEEGGQGNRPAVGPAASIARQMRDKLYEGALDSVAGASSKLRGLPHFQDLSATGMTSTRMEEA